MVLSLTECMLIEQGVALGIQKQGVIHQTETNER